MSDVDQIVIKSMFASLARHDLLPIVLPDVIESLQRAKMLPRILIPGMLDDPKLARQYHPQVLALAEEYLSTLGRPNAEPERPAP